MSLVLLTLRMDFAYCFAYRWGFQQGNHWHTDLPFTALWEFDVCRLLV